MKPLKESLEKHKVSVEPKNHPKNLKEKYKINNIQFLGQLSNKETVDLISKSKAVLSATKLYEGQPTLLCEASLNGKASLFPDSGGINEFLPNDYEFIFEQFNYEDLEKKILN